MTEIDHLRSRRYPLPELLHDFFVRADRQRDRLVNVPRSGLVTVELPGIIAGAIFMVTGQDFIARL